MDSRLVIAVLLGAILFFGCTSPTTPTNQSGGQGGVPSGQQGTGQQGGSQQGGGTQGGGQQGGNDFTGKTYVELMALGVPMQCNVKTTDGETTTMVKLYKGIGTDMRTEMASEIMPCPIVVSIIKEDRYYVGCKDGEIMPGCQWLMFVTNESAMGTPGAFQEPDYSSAPAADISCEPWIPDESMLQAPANACSLEDLMKPPVD